MFFSPEALLFFVPALGVAALAHWWIKKVVQKTAHYATTSEASGGDAAIAVLQSAGVNAVFVEDAPGQQLDHYAPAEKGLLLRPQVYNERTLRAVAFAGHEVGHALQDAAGYKYLAARTNIVQLATVGSLTGLILLTGGFLLIESILVYVGILVFTATVVAQVLNLAVEFDASRRALPHLLAAGVIHENEKRVVRRVMWAASLVHLAATWTSIPTAYRYLVKPRRQAGEEGAAPETVVESTAAAPIRQPAAGVAGKLEAAMERLQKRARV